MQPEKPNVPRDATEILRQHLEASFQLPTHPPKKDDTDERPSKTEATPVNPVHAVATAANGEAAQITELLKQTLGEKSFQHAFADKTSVTVCDDEVVIGAASPFLASWMQKQFRDVVVKTAQHIMGPEARVRFEVDQTQAASLIASASANTTGKLSFPSAGPTPAKKPVVTASGNHRGGRQFSRLEDYLPGEGNSLAITAVREICQSPGSQYSPLYLHGGVGLGKTHLLEGIYRNLRAKNPSLRILYITAESFTNYFTAALREKTLPSFRQRFRNLQVMLVDDLDFLDSKRGIQEEFLHTYRQLELGGGQLVFTADRHPRLMSNLCEELATRCLSGLVCRLEMPDTNTRHQIAAAHAHRQRVEISDDILQFLATRFSRNVRELRGAVNILATYAKMVKRPVTLGMARKVLIELERDCTRIIRMTDVEQTVCQFFGVSPKELKSGKRVRALTQPRMLAMFLIRKHTRAAYQEIGQYFGGRNHATVISAEKKVLGWLDGQETIKIATEEWPIEEVVEALERQLQAG